CLPRPYRPLPAVPFLFLQELGGWDWDLCRRELPAVLPRLLISFLGGRFGYCVVAGSHPEMVCVGVRVFLQQLCAV
uniref:Uncharacterized protein n=1 Tax=Strigops habroptila TaxID=2489341 RepID=A0A672U945_STRHB